MTNVPNVKLNNGFEIPQFVLGVYKMKEKIRIHGSYQVGF